MIGFYVMMIAVLGLAAAAGYTIVSTLQASNALSLGSRNIARLEQTADALRHVVVVDPAGGLFVPMAATVPSGSGGEGAILPDWVSGMAITPWGTPFAYCPYGVHSWGPGGTTPATVPYWQGGSHEVATFEDVTVHGAARAYVARGSGDAGLRPAHPLDAAGAPQPLAFLIAPISNSRDVPSCDAVYWRGGAWLVDGMPGGAVRAITQDSLTDSLSAAPRSLRRHVAPGGSGSGLTGAAGDATTLEHALAEWRSLRPARMVIELAPAAEPYRIDPAEFDLGAAGSALPFPAAVGRMLEIRRAPGAGSAVLAGPSGAGEVVFGLPVDVAFDGVGIGADTVLEVGPMARVVLRDGVVNGRIRVRGGDLALLGTTHAPGGNDPAIHLEGGRVAFLGGVGFDLSGSGAEAAVRMEGGHLQFDGTTSLADGSVFLRPGSTGTVGEAAGAVLTIDGVPEPISGLRPLLSSDLALTMAETAPGDCDSFSCVAICSAGRKAVGGSCLGTASNVFLVEAGVTETGDGHACSWQPVELADLGVTVNGDAGVFSLPAATFTGGVARAFCVPATFLE